MIQDGQIGIKKSIRQVSLLLIVTAFVGGMVGMERSLIPKLATSVFHLDSKTAMLSFIVAFGVTKAVTNYYAGYFSNKFGRRKLLITGWLVALPVPWILMYAPSWNWIIGANVLLGMNQGLAWSSTVVMKMDIVEESKRGLAMGLNEFAGYFAVGLVTILVAYVAARHGLRPYPFYVGVLLSVAGLMLSILFIKDTGARMADSWQKDAHRLEMKNVFWGTTVYNRNLSAVTQAGLANNMNDGMMWGLYPLLLQAKGFTIAEAGIIIGIYPACWGIGQLFSGRWGDMVEKKRLLFSGMLLQAVTLFLFFTVSSFAFFILLSIALGCGKALVYPIFAASIAENVNARQRAQSIGTFRFWRDSGYPIGAVITGVLADAAGIDATINIVGAITLLSAFVIQFRMQSPPKTDPVYTQPDRRSHLSTF